MGDYFWTRKSNRLTEVIRVIMFILDTDHLLTSVDYGVNC